MDVQNFVYRTQSAVPDDVYIIRDKGKYGLIRIPGGDDDIPDTLAAEELRTRGGSFITQPIWDDIKVNHNFQDF